MYPERESLRFCARCSRRVMDGEEKQWHGLCRSCATDALTEFKYMMWGLTNEQRAVLDDLFDGVALSEFKGVKLK